jgi:hypothetical protein
VSWKGFGASGLMKGRQVGWGGVSGGRGFSVNGLILKGCGGGRVGKWAGGGGVWYRGFYCECISGGAWCKGVRHYSWCICQTMCSEDATIGAAWRVQWTIILREHHNTEGEQPAGCRLIA